MDDLMPIRSDAQHAKALAELSSLMYAAPGSAEERQLELLSILVERYERQRWPMAALDPVDFLREAMEQCGIMRRDLERAIGSRTRVTEVLNRRRALTLPMIRALSLEFGLPAQPLLGAYLAAHPQRKRPSALAGSGRRARAGVGRRSA
ncbi:MAG: transcriptional regulator [Alphaproteobacteria bacterium]|nr:transcriptional regulator [Alphaproteobacteria bacterium]